MRTRGPLVVVAAVLPGRLSKTRHATAMFGAGLPAGRPGRLGDPVRAEIAADDGRGAGHRVCGAIFSGELVGDIAAALHGLPLPSGFSSPAGASPAVLKHLPTAIRDGYISGFAQAPLPGELPGRSP